MAVSATWRADEEALRQAVLASPGVDELRLAYADACAAQDDAALQARADFIRAQIELIYVSPEVLRTGGAYDLQRRIASLHERWAGAWTEPLRPDVQSAQFFRGFAELVRMTAKNFLDHAETVSSLAPVSHLDLVDVREVEIEDLFESEHLLRFRSLGLDDCGLETADIEVLAKSPNCFFLRWLSLRNNRLDAGAARAMAASPYLKGLRVAHFDGNPVDPTEELGIEGELVVDTRLPLAGYEIEQEFGPVRWLHWMPANGRFEV
jgi:uncharacterized protein (TIGR02996 family)